MPTELTFTVPTRHGASFQVSATCFLPSVTRERLVAVLAVPGGGYDRSYWDLSVPGHDGYSFAAHLAAAGALVVAMDNLGTGASDRPVGVDQLDVEALAAAVAAVARSVRERLTAGSLGPIGPLEGFSLVGVGHSLGAQTVVAAQALHPVFDGVAALGGSFIGNSAFGVAPDLDTVRAGLQAMSGDSWASGYLDVPRELSRRLFHAPDVPDAIVEAESHHVTVLPREAGVQGVAGSALAAYPPMVTVPVFVAFGDIDTSPDPEAEPALYSSSPDVTYFRVPGSGHCHNSSSHRTQLWDALLRWSAALAQ